MSARWTALVFEPLPRRERHRDAAKRLRRRAQIRTMKRHVERFRSMQEDLRMALLEEDDQERPVN